MFARRKRQEPFEWHKYVRTTVKLRREDRRKRLAAAQDAAVVGMKQAGRASVSAGAIGASALGRLSVRALRALGRLLGRWLRRSGAALGRYLGLLIERFPELGPALVGRGRTVAAVLLALFVCGIAWVLLAGGIAGLTGPSTMVIKGRAVALTGETFRLNGKQIRLAGIEAPEPEQQCGIPGERPWRCGAAAQGTLNALTRNRPLSCEIAGSDDTGRLLATCFSGQENLAAALVARGAVFAEQGLFARYTAQESEARAKKLGLWRGAAERPADFRAKSWEAAKAAAPNGCPIKGYATARGLKYVMPWAAEYPRLKVRERRGARWFCSEREAMAAGYRPLQRS